MFLRLGPSPRGLETVKFVQRPVLTDRVAEMKSAYEAGGWGAVGAYVLIIGA